MRYAAYVAQETCNGWDDFVVGPGAALYLLSTLYSCGLAVDTERSWTFAPPVAFLDLPLAVGKTWSTTTSASAFGYNPHPCVISFEVVGSETVTVPLGTFEVMVVVQAPSCGLEGGTYYLNRNLGPVILPGGYKLVSTSGIQGTEAATWGGLKAL